MDRQGKELFVSELRDLGEKYPFVLLVHQSGVTVEKITRFRKQAREQGCIFKVVKNRLAKRAFEGKPESFLELFNGPTGVLIGEDPAASSKVAVDFSKENEAFKIVGALLEKKVLDRGSVEGLAKLPSIEQLRGQLLGVLMAPGTRLVSALQGVAQKLVGVLEAHRQKGE